jgi:hypothetical protein
MPYKLNNPDDVAHATVPVHTPALTAAERELLEDPTAAIRDQLAELAEPIHRAAAEQATEAVARVAASKEWATLRGAAAAVRDAYARFEAERQRVARDGELSDDGRHAAVERAAVVRDAAVERVAELALSDAGDRLLRDFPARPVAILAPELAAHATFIVTAADGTLPETVLTAALDLLRTATDTSASAAERSVATKLLDAAYTPLLQRYAAAPPKHWQRWAAHAHDAVELIEQHSATMRGARFHAVARAAVQQFRTDFSFIVGTVRELGRWDDVVLIGAESFRHA